MKVILLKEVKNLGHIGEVKEVNNGYARNFLIPGGQAIIASDSNLEIIKKQAEKKAKIKKEVKKVKKSKKDKKKK